MSFQFALDRPPFQFLSATEQAQWRAVALHVRLQAGDELLRAQGDDAFLWVIESGHVQLSELGHVHVLGAGDALSWRALLTGACDVLAQALDDVVAWQLPSATVRASLAANPRLAEAVLTLAAGHLRHDAAQDEQREMTALMLVPVREAHLRQPLTVDGALDLVHVCALLAEHKQTHALVSDARTQPPRLGMFTTTDLRDALLRDTPPAQLPVREVARFDLISVSPDAALFEALLVMLRHCVHRLLVAQDANILGVLTQLDLMSYVSNHSHLIALMVEQAQSIDALAQAAHQVDATIKTLQRSGMRVDVISSLVSELNSQIFARLWALIAPLPVQQASCLLVMGSEGRSEQLLKTDQDNALILRDNFDFVGLPELTAQFSAALLRFGYPPCPGQIMLTNPLWCQPLRAMRQLAGEWLIQGSTDGQMNLAILMDARAVAGDAALLDDLRAHVWALSQGQDMLLARMAAAIDQFAEPSQSWLNRLPLLHAKESETFDLKKIGTFPIVHGARVLALQQRIEARATDARLQTLAQAQILPADLARDLIETLRMLMGLKLRHNLRQRALGQPIGNQIEWASLGTLDRDQLKDALGIIGQFKQYVRRHFRLEL